MKRTIPMAITFLTGIFFLITFYTPILEDASDALQESAIVISIFAMAVAVGNLLRVHITRIKRKSEHWPLSIVLIFFLFFTAFVGFMDKGVTGGKGNFAFMYRNFYEPLGATMFSTLAFYIASAAFRAFRIRTFEAGLLLASGFLVMLGRVPLGAAIWSQFPDIASWIMQVPVTAGQRAITIGIALGGVSMSTKIILGFERSHLGGGE